MSDLISRQAAIDALKNRWKKTRNYEGNGDDIAEECELYLKQLPSAQPERKKGKWKRRIVDSGYNADWICSECGYRVKTDFVNYNFCPHCGAKMIEPQESENKE